MKYLFLIITSLVFISCSGDNYPNADNELTATQSFLDACMKGDFKQANFYMKQDSENAADLNKMKEAYYKNTADQRQEYRSASIIVEDNETVDTNTKIITYKNSYDKIDRKIKAINNNGDWKIDLKYTFSGNL
ncbi:hypothetical protein A9P82_00755 [Arachidicoccus ginsenosidimutans]|uniref:hypothetical protein n=1 Tax=Arachidicoccus sp. BS20 TaxID=1850526 RepID=UPI0007F0B114|nr:hypothetical protein [Arachidicoccus sp. BS20]ANI87973.1 hypothetical protein A9P82_00755 [Arachidicoccus sp. BS20]